MDSRGGVLGGSRGARSSWYSQTLGEVVVLEARGARGARVVPVVLLVRGLLPSRSLQEHP